MTFLMGKLKTTRAVAAELGVSPLETRAWFGYTAPVGWYSCVA
ncbi:hypothetical protein ABT237_24855 [Streptomyces sp. NPDC001581]